MYDGYWRENLLFGLEPAGYLFIHESMLLRLFYFILALLDIYERMYIN